MWLAAAVVLFAMSCAWIALGLFVWFLTDAPKDDDDPWRDR